jgi:hypothetical protein
MPSKDGFEEKPSTNNNNDARSTRSSRPSQKDRSAIAVIVMGRTSKGESGVLTGFRMTKFQRDIQDSAEVKDSKSDRGDWSNTVRFFLVILGGSARVSYSHAMTYNKNDAKYCSRRRTHGDTEAPYFGLV